MANTNNQFGLLKERRFAPFFITQFLGAFNDNVYKNALVDTGTFIAILVGTIAGIVLISSGSLGIYLVCAGTISIAVAGWLASRSIPLSPAPVPDLAVSWNAARETARNLLFLKNNRTVFLSVLGISWFWFVFRTGRAIPIAPARENPRMLEQAYEDIARALEEGHLIGVFPEGRITDTGELYPFRPGIKRIVDRTPVPVVPLALRGLWGSFFSRKGGKAMTRPFAHGLFPKVALVADKAVPPQLATPEGLRQSVLALRGDWK